jgi:hypothetical protein
VSGLSPDFSNLPLNLNSGEPSFKRAQLGRLGCAASGGRASTAAQWGSVVALTLPHVPVAAMALWHGAARAAACCMHGALVRAQSLAAPVTADIRGAFGRSLAAAALRLRCAWKLHWQVLEVWFLRRTLSPGSVGSASAGTGSLSWSSVIRFGRLPVPRTEAGPSTRPTRIGLSSIICCCQQLLLVVARAVACAACVRVLLR